MIQLMLHVRLQQMLHMIKLKLKSKNKILTSKINAGIFKEVIGQGTVEKRNFGLFEGALKINLHNYLNWEKELSISSSSESEITNRGGDTISSLNLFSNQTNVSLSGELTKNFFVQTSFTQFTANGNEFLTQRDNYGKITYFTPTKVNQKDFVLSFGMLYTFRKNVYTNLQYKWWGMTFDNQQNLDYKYNRLILIISVEL